MDFSPLPTVSSRRSAAAGRSGARTWPAIGGLPGLADPWINRCTNGRKGSVRRRQGGPMIRAGRSEDGQPMPPDPAKPDPDRSGEPSSATLTETVAETQTVAETELDPATGPSAEGGIFSALRRAVSHNWVRHLILILVYQG